MGQSSNKNKDSLKKIIIFFTFMQPLVLWGFMYVFLYVNVKFCYFVLLLLVIFLYIWKKRKKFLNKKKKKKIQRKKKKKTLGNLTDVQILVTEEITKTIRLTKILRKVTWKDMSRAPGLLFQRLLLKVCNVSNVIFSVEA